MKALKLEKCGLFDAKEIQKFAVYEDAMVELTSPAWSNALKVVLNLLPAASVALQCEENETFKVELNSGRRPTMRKNDLGLMTEEEIKKSMNFNVAEEDPMDLTGINWRTGAKYALAAAPATTVALPVAAAAAVQGIYYYIIEMADL